MCVRVCVCVWGGGGGGGGIGHNCTFITFLVFAKPVKLNEI